MNERKEVEKVNELVNEYPISNLQKTSQFFITQEKPKQFNV